MTLTLEVQEGEKASGDVLLGVGTAAVLKSFCCFIPWCPSGLSSPYQSHHSWQSCDSTELHIKWTTGPRVVPGHPQGSGLGGAEYHRRSPGNSEGIHMELHPPAVLCTCPCGEGDPRGPPAFQERFKQNRKAYEQMLPLLPRLCSTGISCGERFNPSCSATCPALVHKQPPKS